MEDSSRRELENELTEIEKVQNPAFCAVLLWTYGRKYQLSLTENPSNLLLYFLILPLCLHRPTLENIVSTRVASGLGKFCEKLGVEREELFAIHERCLILRKLTLDAIVFGVRAGLFAVDYKKGLLLALDQKPPKMPEQTKCHVKGAGRLGVFFAPLEVGQIFQSLKVEA